MFTFTGWTDVQTHLQVTSRLRAYMCMLTTNGFSSTSVTRLSATFVLRVDDCFMRGWVGVRCSDTLAWWIVCWAPRCIVRRMLHCGKGLLTHTRTHAERRRVGDGGRETMTIAFFILWRFLAICPINVGVGWGVGHYQHVNALAWFVVQSRCTRQLYCWGVCAFMLYALNFDNMYL